MPPIQTRLDIVTVGGGAEHRVDHEGGMVRVVRQSPALTDRAGLLASRQLPTITDAHS